MCLTCGCQLPHEDHGKTEYLTIQDLERSAAVDSYSLDEAVKNLVATVDVAKGEAGHQPPGSRASISSSCRRRGTSPAAGRTKPRRLRR